jgi:hypothetical protein
MARLWTCESARSTSADGAGISDACGRSKIEAIEDAEHCRVDADPERERDDDDRCKAGRSACRAPGVRQILLKHIEEPDPCAVPHFFSIVGPVPESPRRAGRAFVLDVHLGVKPHLVVDVSRVGARSHDGSHAVLQSVEPRHHDLPPAAGRRVGYR